MKRLFSVLACVLCLDYFQAAPAAAEAGDSIDEDIVVHRKGSKPILPDWERRRGKPIPVAANEITFSFDSPDHPWSAEERSVLQQWVNDIYPAIKKVYGNPAFDIALNVRKDPNIALAGVYDPSSNEMILRGLNVDVFCHEVIHAFHDDLIISANIFEEGMARAAEIAVFSSLSQYSFWDSNHSYGIDVFYDLNNQSGIASLGGNFSSGFINVLMRYQQAGYAWGKVYLEHPDFFRKFNAKYYAAALRDRSGLSQGDVEKLTDLAGAVAPMVEKQQFADWYRKQQIFNIHPETGKQVVLKGDNNTLYVFSRDRYGQETMFSGITVSWNLFSCQGAHLSSGSAVTGPYGWVEIPVADLVYQGKVLIDVSIDYPNDTATEKSFITYAGVGGGLFGVTSACDGEVRVRGKGTYKARIVNGAFSIPTLAAMAGTFTVKHGRNEKTVTKDASDYFVSIP